MKTAGVISRHLLALIFLVFGVNGFVHFMPPPQMSPVGGQFIGALTASHYFTVIVALQILSALLLLSGRYVPLALVMLAPIIVNIFFFHALMAPAGIAAPVILVVLWTIVAVSTRSSFDPLLRATSSA